MKTVKTKSAKKSEMEWVNYKPDEIKELVVNLAKEGNSSSKIGIILRDQHGIPDVRMLTGMTITKIMKENKVHPDLPEDLLDLMKRAVDLRSHLLKNKHDLHSKRGLEKMESTIRVLVKYYIKNKKLPEGWAYDPERAKLLVQK